MSDPDFIKRASHEMNAALSFLEAMMNKTAVTVTAIRKGLTPLQRESIKLPKKIGGPSSVLPPQQTIAGRPSIPRPPTQVAPGGLVGPSGKPLQPSAPAAPAPVKPLAPPTPPPVAAKPAAPAPAPQRPTQGLEDLRAGPAPSKPAPLPSAAPAAAAPPSTPLKSSIDIAMNRDLNATRGTKPYQGPVPGAILQPGGTPAGKPGGQPPGQPAGQPAGQPEGQPSGKKKAPKSKGGTAGKEPATKADGGTAGQPAGQPEPKANVGPAGPVDPKAQEYERMKQLVGGETPKELAEFHKATGTADPSVTSPWKSGLLDAGLMMGIPMAAGALLPEGMQMPAFIGAQLAMPRIRGIAQQKAFGYNPAEASAARTSWMQGQSPEQYLTSLKARQAAAPPK